ncbi:hypothetical protein CKS_4528 [Pantoea stewartii subsp. stewartii DC283]|uniref:Surface presentation of antigen domain-containing protein n=1 Tax=Pantoea stewartii subsp. stewartii DC283 TaxID=660596 RepID=H3RL03_PANSE|nr:hypothetical protein CKS_4528 [Pantoea stewartii subsp. stewartii DC283]
MSDDSALLEWVDKKKKQNRLDEQPSSAAVTAQMLVQVLNGAFTGGEWQQKENKAANAAALPKPARPLSRSDDGLRQKVMLTASVRTEGTLIKPLATGDRPTAIAPPMKVSESTPRAVTVEAARPEMAVISQPLTARVTQSEGASHHPESSPQHKDELNEERPTLAPGRAVDFRPNAQSERQVQTRAVPATLQQLKGQVSAATAAPSAKEAQTLEVDYSFQRWSGDHSVKVTIPAQALREGNMTLLPSDARAADALSRNLGTLAGHSPELLQPRQERDEQQKREQQPQQDEEQE